MNSSKAIPGILFTGGAAPKRPPRGIDFEGALVVAADSGVETALAWEVRPRLVVGDMDSISEPEVLDHFGADEVRRYGREKDYTDTELGLMALWELGAGEITVIGGGGGRLDHLLGMVALFDRDTHPRRWYTENELVECVDDELVLPGAVGETVSFFPAGSGPTRMESEGLKWPLNGLIWSRGDLGISNEVIDEKCRVRVTEGRLILVRNQPRVLP